MGRRPKNDVDLPEEMLEKIRITPEMTEEFMEKHSAKITPRPSDLGKVPRGKLWCPYCAEVKKFVNSRKVTWSTYARCETCTISTEDFYVKTHNHLWGDMKLR